MAPPNQVLQLIERFERYLDHYKRSAYKETEVRVEFIDPFFEALGWDIHNRQGRGEHDKDVIHEDAIRVGGKTLAPDYSFRVGRARKFFLEAKKPAVSLEGDVGPAYQLRRYSWSVKLPLHQKLAAASIPADKYEPSVRLYQRQVEATDRQIDALVYELYGLMEEEIGIVAGAGE